METVREESLHETVFLEVSALGTTSHSLLPLLELGSLASWSPVSTSELKPALGFSLAGVTSTKAILFGLSFFNLGMLVLETTATSVLASAASWFDCFLMRLVEWQIIWRKRPMNVLSRRAKSMSGEISEDRSGATRSFVTMSEVLRFASFATKFESP